MNVSKEIRIAVLVILSIGLLYWGINFLKGKDIFKSQRTYYAVYKNTEGLTANKPVSVNGYKIGTIEAILMNPDNPSEITVQFSVEYPIDVPKNSIAQIYSVGLLGEKQIELLLGDAPLLAEGNDTLVGTQEAGLMDDVNEKLNPIVQKTDIVLGTFNQTLNELLDSTNSKGIANIIKNLDATTAAVSDYTTTNNQRLSQITANLASVSQNLESNNENITALLENLSSISDSAKEIEFIRIAESLEQAIAQTNTLLAGINSGEGTLGKLAKDPNLYDQLALTSYQLNRLLIDLQNNPKRYINVSVFGKRTKPTDEEAIDKQLERNSEQLELTK